jgi:hypothetical protein
MGAKYCTEREGLCRTIGAEVPEIDELEITREEKKKPLESGNIRTRCFGRLMTMRFERRRGKRNIRTFKQGSLKALS